MKTGPQALWHDNLRLFHDTSVDNTKLEFERMLQTNSSSFLYWKTCAQAGFNNKTKGEIKVLG